MYRNTHMMKNDVCNQIYFYFPLKKRKKNKMKNKEKSSIYFKSEKYHGIVGNITGKLKKDLFFLYFLTNNAVSFLFLLYFFRMLKP